MKQYEIIIKLRIAIVGDYMLAHVVTFNYNLYIFFYKYKRVGCLLLCTVRARLGKIERALPTIT